MAKEILKQQKVATRLQGPNGVLTDDALPENLDAIENSVNASDLPEQVKEPILKEIAEKRAQAERAFEEPIFDHVVKATPKSGGDTYIRLHKGITGETYRWNGAISDYKDDVSLNPDEEPRWVKE